MTVADESLVLEQDQPELATDPNPVLGQEQTIESEVSLSLEPKSESDTVQPEHDQPDESESQNLDEPGTNSGPLEEINQQTDVHQQEPEVAAVQKIELELVTEPVKDLDHDVAILDEPPEIEIASAHNPEPEHVEELMPTVGLVQHIQPEAEELLVAEPVQPDEEATLDLKESEVPEPETAIDHQSERLCILQVERVQGRPVDADEPIEEKTNEILHQHPGASFDKKESNGQSNEEVESEGHSLNPDECQNLSDAPESDGSIDGKVERDRDLAEVEIILPEMKSFDAKPVAPEVMDLVENEAVPVYQNSRQSGLSDSDNDTKTNLESEHREALASPLRIKYGESGIELISLGLKIEEDCSSSSTNNKVGASADPDSLDQSLDSGPDSRSTLRDRKRHASSKTQDRGVDERSPGKGRGFKKGISVVVVKIKKLVSGMAHGRARSVDQHEQPTLLSQTSESEYGSEHGGEAAQARPRYNPRHEEPKSLNCVEQAALNVIDFMF